MRIANFEHIIQICVYNTMTCIYLATQLHIVIVALKYDQMLDNILAYHCKNIVSQWYHLMMSSHCANLTSYLGIKIIGVIVTLKIVSQWHQA